MLTDNEAIEQLLLKEMIEIDSLYDETKRHLDLVAKSRNTGSLAFMHNQLANVIGIKNLKSSLIRDLTSLSKKEFAEKQKASDEGGSNTSPETISQIAEEITAKLLGKSNKSSVPSQDKENSIIESKQDSIEVEDALTERVSRLPKIKTVEEEKIFNADDFEVVIINKNEGTEQDIYLLNKKTNEIHGITSGVIEIEESDFTLSSEGVYFYKGKEIPILYTD
jgi:hypothetical protein